MNAARKATSWAARKQHTEKAPRRAASPKSPTPPRGAAAAKQRVEIDGRELVLSNAAKPYYPDGFTKGEVVGYYSEVAELILPHLRQRPLTLKRFPDGVNHEHFYEKNAPVHTPEWVERFPVARSEGGTIHYILCNDRATLLWATNLGDIEKHVLLARAPELGQPTSVVFDLDPGEGAGIFDCAAVALELRRVLENLGLESYVKVSGSKGLHVSVPLNGSASYHATQPFAKAVAELLEKEHPRLVVSKMAKSLRKGKVLIDWSQNSDFKTTVCVYAMRAKRNEPYISMPVTWKELQAALRARNEGKLSFSPESAVKRLRKVGDLFEPVLSREQALPERFTSALPAPARQRLHRWPAGSRKERDTSIHAYTAKRDATRTPEPTASALKTATGKPRAGKALKFVIQKHEASHLHFDWRLEMEGVLRSWAVPKGPPTEPRQARLAMHVEDHPLEYATFEGTIPAGNYGAGTVMVWDYGEYEDITGDAAAAYHSGKMHLRLRGAKLRGEWILLKDRREEGNKWLLIKAGSPQKLTARQADLSAVSGRTMREIAKAPERTWQSNQPAGKTVAARKPARAKRSDTKKCVAGFVEPMRCKSVSTLPDDGGWAFELKYDGYRCIAVKGARRVILYSRTGNKLNDRFPAVARALEKVEGTFTIDGEVVALDPQGRPSFQLLQNSAGIQHPVYFYAFDLLHRNGTDLLALGLGERRGLLAELAGEWEDPLRDSPVMSGGADKVLEAVTALGLEGVVAKRSGSCYEPGQRSGAWVKLHVGRGQEFVIGGYIPGTRGFDALLVGVYREGSLVYAGQVRNGFVARIRDDVWDALKKLPASRQCPFSDLPETKRRRWGALMDERKMRECRWVQPDLVCQLAFAEWTEGGRLRHPTFVGMRDDKPAAEVVRES